MAEGKELTLTLRRQELTRDERGRTCWKTIEEQCALPAERVAIVLCDVWDDHGCRAAKERLEAMVPRMNEVVRAARAMGVHIIHAPSETMDFYAGTPARQRMLDMPPVEPPPEIEHPDPPLPIDDSDTGCDSGPEPPPPGPWTRQHPGIEIDQDVDGISDDGRQVYSALRHWGVELVIIMGVHTNMCVLNRSFAIKQMVRWRVPIALCRDLTDALYNPAMPPYVSHDEGVQLVIGYIEKFWCPSVSSEDLVRASG